MVTTINYEPAMPQRDRLAVAGVVVGLALSGLTWLLLLAGAWSVGLTLVQGSVNIDVAILEARPRSVGSGAVVERLTAPYIPAAGGGVAGSFRRRSLTPYGWVLLGWLPLVPVLAGVAGAVARRRYRWIGAVVLLLSIAAEAVMLLGLLIW